VKRTLPYLMVVCLFAPVGTSAIAKGTALGYQPARVADATTRKPARKIKQPLPARLDVVVDSTPKAELRDRRE
jgi:hypothetical protein